MYIDTLIKYFTFQTTAIKRLYKYSTGNVF